MFTASHIHIHDRAYSATPISQVLKTGHGTSPDWWACGVLMYEMLFGKTPFAPPEQLLQQAVALDPAA